ncbi:MAG: hypothetical protein ACK56F_08850, partial [bacterium]
FGSGECRPQGPRVPGNDAPPPTRISPEGAGCMDIDHSVYFYTYSTIAQTLAGSFGFLVAAVVFRLQAISSRVDQFAEQVLQTSPAEAARLRDIRVSGDWSRLISLQA